MTSEFLKLPLEERGAQISRMKEIAKKYSLKVLFWGSTLGVREHAVVVFESKNYADNYMKFQREWQSLGTEGAGLYLKHTRTVTVF